MRHLIWVRTACQGARKNFLEYKGLAKCTCILLTHFQHRILDYYIPRIPRVVIHAIMPRNNKNEWNKIQAKPNLVMHEIYMHLLA